MLYSFIILCLTSLFFLILALLPSLPILLSFLSLSDNTIGFEGIFMLGLSLILFPVAWMLSIFVYGRIQKKYILYTLPRFIIIFTALIITSFSATWYRLSVTTLTYQTNNKIAELNFNVSLLSEEIIEVNDVIGNKDYPGVNPTKYHYSSKVRIENPTDKTHENLTLTIFPGYAKRTENCAGFRSHTPSPLKITIPPGDTYIEKTLPVGFYEGCHPPSGVKVTIRFYAGPHATKSYQVPSKLTQWESVFHEQTTFSQQYQNTSLVRCASFQNTQKEQCFMQEAIQTKNTLLCEHSGAFQTYCLEQIELTK